MELFSFLFRLFMIVYGNAMDFCIPFITFKTLIHYHLTSRISFEKFNPFFICICSSNPTLTHGLLMVIFIINVWNFTVVFLDVNFFHSLCWSLRIIPSYSLVLGNFILIFSIHNFFPMIFPSILWNYIIWILILWIYKYLYLFCFYFLLYCHLSWL